jgi:phosphate-selective porin OprO/OprP
MNSSRTQSLASASRCALVVRALGLCALASGLFFFRPCFSQTWRLPPVSPAPPGDGSIEERLQQLESAHANAIQRLDYLSRENDRLAELVSARVESPPQAGLQPVAPRSLQPPPNIDESSPWSFSAIKRVAALQPAPGGNVDDRTQAEQRIRDLEGLGPAPGTTSEDENRSTGSVPDKPTVAWTGELQVDDVMLSQSPANVADLGQLEGFSDFRRARLGAIGSLYWNTIYRLEFDFAQQARPSFLDVYGQLTDLAVIGNLRVGHFFEPFAISRLTSNRYQTFMERPLLDAFAPSRNLGVMAFDTFDEKKGTWQIGLFAADTNDDGEEQTNRGGEAVTGRVTWLPYWDEPADGRYYMHTGACFSYRLPPEQQARFGYWPGFRPGAFDTIVWPRWADTGLINVNDVTLFDLEWAWVMGPFHVQAEWAANLVNQIGGPDLTFTAWYVEAGWFLTGENRPYQQEMAIFNRVTPFESFFLTRTRNGLCSGRGAWQVAFRIDDLNLNDHNIQGGHLVDLTVGLNWHLNPYTRFYFNYVHAMLTDGAPDNYGNLWGIRGQFEF